MTPATIHETAYEYHSWADLGEEIFTLAKAILKSGKHFNRVVALAKGGLAFSRSMTDYLNVKALSTMQIEFYTGVNETAKMPVITQNLPVSIRGENVLLFDDVTDKGDTMKLALSYLQTQGAKDLTTATLICKPWSSVKPDFFARETKAWVIFPNESRETIGLLKKQWQEKRDTMKQVQANLRKIGFPEAEVEFFTQT
jgi:hypoxanthine phosphoribosyltransferase